MDYLEAALTVLREEAKPLHWTVIQDLALRRGYLDPFTQPDIRRNLLAALRRDGLANVLVVLFSASPDLKSHMQAVGAVAFVSKPFDIDDLVATCRSVTATYASS